MKHFFQQDGIGLGMVTGLGSGMLTALILWVGLSIAGEPWTARLRWFGVCFIPPVLLLRHYARTRSFPVTVKTLIVTLFVAFVAFMFVCFQFNEFDLR